MFKSVQKPNYRPLIVFILLKYQILAKLRPKWVSGGENDSLSVLKLTELSSGIFKLSCKTLWFLQKPKNKLCTTSSSRDMEFLDFGSVSDDPRPSRGRKWANICQNGAKTPRVKLIGEVGPLPPFLAWTIVYHYINTRLVASIRLPVWTVGILNRPYWEFPQSYTLSSTEAIPSSSNHN